MPVSWFKKLLKAKLYDMNNFMKEAIKLSSQNIKKQFGWPFGAIIVKDWKIVWKWFNHVVKNNDPTAHWEIMAIRNACKKLWTFDLSDCEIYTSCEPCPMCLGAIYRARINKIRYANTQKDADWIGFDDTIFYQEIEKPISQRKVKTEQIMHKEAQKVFEQRKNEIKNIHY